MAKIKRLISENWKRYVLSLTRAFLGGFLASFTLAVDGATAITPELLRAAIMGAIVTGFVFALKLLMEWLK